MKRKFVIALVGLLSLAIISTAFVQKPSTLKTPVVVDKNDESFLAYLSQFKKVDLPYSIGVDDMEGYADYRSFNPKIIIKNPSENQLKSSQFLPESMQGKFSRMGPPELQPIARFYPNGQMVAVVYSSTQPFGEGLNKSYNLVLYDLKGNILPKAKEKMSFTRAFNIAYSSLEKTMTCSIDARGNISQQVYKNQWRKNVANNGLEGNKIQAFKAESTLAYQIDSNGKIAEQKQSVVALRTRP